MEILLAWLISLNIFVPYRHVEVNINSIGTLLRSRVN